MRFAQSSHGGSGASGEEPSVQGNPLNTWTADPVFTSLMPGEKYYAFARVKGLPGLDAVTSDEVQVDLGSAEPGPSFLVPMAAMAIRAAMATVADNGNGGDNGGGDHGNGSGGDRGDGNGNSGGGDGSDGSGGAPDGSEKPQRPEGEQPQPDVELDTPEETPGASGKPANGKPVSGLPSTGDASNADGPGGFGAWPEHGVCRLDAKASPVLGD